MKRPTNAELQKTIAALQLEIVNLIDTIDTSDRKYRDEIRDLRRQKDEVVSKNTALNDFVCHEGDKNTGILACIEDYVEVNHTEFRPLFNTDGWNNSHGDTETPIGIKNESPNRCRRPHLARALESYR